MSFDTPYCHQEVTHFNCIRIQIYLIYTQDSKATMPLFALQKKRLAQVIVYVKVNDHVISK